MLVQLSLEEIIGEQYAKCNRIIPFGVEMPHEADGTPDFRVKSSEIKEPCFNAIIKQNQKTRQSSEKCRESEL